MTSPRRAPARDHVDVAIVGAGFGGLGAALRAAELGLRVALFETLSYPGGCASTFRRGGAWYESGATLFAGLGPGGFFASALAKHGVATSFELLDPVLHVRAGGVSFEVSAERARFVDTMARLEPEHAENVRRFFADQARLAASLWSLFETPDLLVPFGLRALARHALHVPRYAPLLRWMGKSLGAMLEAYGLGRARTLRAYLDALCQITVQVGVDEAEAPFALAAIDYPFRGTGHVRGGVGELARGMALAAERAGAELSFTDRVASIERLRGGFVVRTRRGETFAHRVVLNMLPAAAAGVLGEPLYPDGPLARLDTAVRTGWGAAMLYLVVRDEGLLSPHAHHVDITDTTGEAPTRGHHVFASVSGREEDRAGPGMRTVTVSTHVPIPLDERGVRDVQARMRATLAEGYPALARATSREMTASPRTFARFVGRPEGWVGGVPRRVGFDGYRGIVPAPVARGVWLVGDSVFPGQSILACALGGWKTAEMMRARDAW